MISLKIILSYYKQIGEKQSVSIPISLKLSSFICTLRQNFYLNQKWHSFSNLSYGFQFCVYFFSIILVISQACTSHFSSLYIISSVTLFLRRWNTIYCKTLLFRWCYLVLQDTFFSILLFDGTNGIFQSQLYNHCYSLLVPMVRKCHKCHQPVTQIYTV